jgi:hypothetical protein
VLDEARVDVRQRETQPAHHRTHPRTYPITSVCGLSVRTAAAS